MNLLCQGGLVEVRTRDVRLVQIEALVLPLTQGVGVGLPAPHIPIEHVRGDEVGLVGTDCAGKNRTVAPGVPAQREH